MLDEHQLAWAEIDRRTPHLPQRRIVLRNRTSRWAQNSQLLCQEPRNAPQFFTLPRDVAQKCTTLCQNWSTSLDSAPPPPQNPRSCTTGACLFTGESHDS